ncbi:uncharacterized protein BT62DRAFT_935086 [Guyanagaster necrorhizus]|uniref:F-box domain-containing protein n=1 Tax=Guyanagaster necrorhizus TaxID=856835 RepID=A0A9P7VMW7_9AGAR|nr:uncharacterized protein BT62DRAFT_935086 [Guyanagaster necrorhizus MCA 3950]KAG7443468.1 hypothetical protein BT62DRAFT_935086 [Guyanagaster necrorhizus MCA 3950]
MTSPTRTDKSQFHPDFSSFIPEYLQPKRSVRIEELLLSNKPLLEFERKEFLQTAKISATRQLLDFLASERNQAVSNISDAKSLSHPLRNLPDDVLRAIFRACTKSVDQAFDGGYASLNPTVAVESIQPNQSPWTPSFVCQQWRAVAIHDAELWSLTELDLDKRPKDNELAKNRVFRLGLSLFRSNGHDLSIRLHGKDGVPYISPMLQILLPTAPYWKRLSVCLPLSSFQHFSVYKGYLNRLDTLYVGIGNCDSADHLHIDAFRLAPSLKVVGMLLEHWPVAFTHISIPFSRITSFLSGGGNLYTYQSLRRLPRVRMLTLVCWRNFVELEVEPAEPITLPNVTFLHLLALRLPNSSSSVNHMYSLLIIPSLQFLKISFFGSDQILFVYPDSYPIKTLTIEVHNQSQEACTGLPDNLPRFLRRTPQLEELHILTRATNLPDQWINGLVYTSEHDAVAPCLRVLSMPSGLSAGDLCCLVNVIESRRRKYGCLSDGGQCMLLEKAVLGPEPLQFNSEELSERWSALCTGELIVTHRNK